jgi:hypothetical protein
MNDRRPTPACVREAHMFRRFSAVAASAAVAITVFAAPAPAGHDHYLVTPNGSCHQVAAGQTAIADPSHGGFHRFHDNVHLGATEDDNRVLGLGNAAVEVYKNECP